MVFGTRTRRGAWRSTDPAGCAGSQFQRGGLFFVLDSPELWQDLDRMFQRQ